MWMQFCVKSDSLTFNFSACLPFSKERLWQGRSFQWKAQEKIPHTSFGALQWEVVQPYDDTLMRSFPSFWIRIYLTGIFLTAEGNDLIGKKKSSKANLLGPKLQSAFLFRQSAQEYTSCLWWGWKAPSVVWFTMFSLDNKGPLFSNYNSVFICKT